MKKGFLFFVLAVFILFLVSPYASADLTKKPLKSLPSKPSVITTPPPVSMPFVLVNAPASGENWELGSKHDITWTSSNVSGYLRLDLYCDLPSPHKVGTITANTSVSNGKYNWEAGKYLGGAVTTHGKGYRIVVTADNPSMTKSSPQFNLIVASSKIKPVASTPNNILKAKILSLIYPTRGVGFHKGMRYTITWQSINLQDAKLKLELLDSHEQAVIQTIANDFANMGKMDWDVPMTLPDEATFYKIRLQTMDGAQKAPAVPIKISKGTVLPASLKVTNPLSGDRTFGDIIPVKWTSTASCSGNGGPLDAGFRIELMNEYGNQKIMDLTDVGYVFDGEGPAGYLNWHWDWNVARGSCPIGNYTIKVTSMYSKDACSDTTDKYFRIVDPASVKQASLPGSYVNKKHCSAERYDMGDEGPTCPTFPDVPTGQGQVGSWAEYRDLGGFIAASEHESSYTDFRSKMEFPGLSFQHIRDRIVKKATLTLENTMIKSAGGYSGLCTDRLYILNGPWSKCLDMPVRPGFAVPVPGSTGQTSFSLDVTSTVKGWLSGSIPNYGFLLTDLRVFPPAQASDGFTHNACWAYYKATLKLEFE
jgi:hypothetical protein